MAKPTVIQVNVNIKIGKEQIDFAAKETERLYKLVEGGGNSADWAIKRIERIQDMIMNPNALELANDIKGRLRSVEDANGNGTTTISTNGSSTISDAG